MTDFPKPGESTGGDNKQSSLFKKSIIERQREEVDAKKRRDDKETAAVLKDFVESFEDNSNQEKPLGKEPEPAKRHFAATKLLRSGPGTLGPALDGRGRPGAKPLDRYRTDRKLLAFEDYDSPDTETSHRDGENNDASPEDVAPKPTLQLSSLPPRTSLTLIRHLIPKSLIVDSVRVINMPQNNDSNSTERQSVTAIVTLTKDATASDIDSAVNNLQNRYVGYGHYLAISRHLSSTVAGSKDLPMLATASSSESKPFGAKPVFKANTASSSRVPPPQSFAAPPGSHTSYANAQSQYGRNTTAPLQVSVTPPSDLRQLKLIHKTVENVFEHGVELEALLMSRPSVQQDERWSWLWDARSVGGIWYRWRLWEILSGTSSEQVQGRPQTVFSGEAPWLPPKNNLKFEFVTDFGQLALHPDYDSSDEEEGGNDKVEEDNMESAQYLNPLRKAKLTYLLGRLPTRTTLLTKDEVGRVTAFAICHAGRGPEEIVEMLIDNVESPVALSGDFEVYNPDKDNENDSSSAKLIGLFVISDLLSCSASSGVRHSWKYRQLFEHALVARGVFKHLGQVEKEMDWGKMRIDKWRRSVMQVLETWDGWCVFSSNAHAQMVKDMNEAIEIKKDKPQPEIEQVSEKKAAWKTIETSKEQSPAAEVMDVDGEPMTESSDEEMA